MPIGPSQPTILIYINTLASLLFPAIRHDGEILRKRSSTVHSLCGLHVPSHTRRGEPPLLASLPLRKVFFLPLPAHPSTNNKLIINLKVIIFLCIASVQHHKSIALSTEEKDLPKTGRAAKKRRPKIRRLRLHYLSIASLCAVLSVVCTVFEVFALFSVEFCGGEDLMMLYWGFWSVLQVGSNIAIFGVMLQFWIVLGDVETPSWAVALGTPVLVFAALGFVLKALWTKAWTRCRARKGGNDLESQSEDDEPGPVDDTVGVKRDEERHCSQA